MPRYFSIKKTKHKSDLSFVATTTNVVSFCVIKHCYNTVVNKFVLQNSLKNVEIMKSRGLKDIAIYGCKNIDGN